jgi:phage tail protein X
LRAIECYTDKYDTMDSLNVYSTTESGIENVSYSEYGISEIYDKLSKPYDTLQQMLDEKYGDDYE